MIFSHMLVWQVLVMGLAACMFAAACFLPLMTWAAARQAANNKRAAYKRMATQLGVLGGAMVVATVLAGLALGAYFAFNHGRLLEGPLRLGVYALLVLALVALVGGVLLYKVPHAVGRAGFAFVCMLLLAFVAAAMIRAVFLPGFAGVSGDASVYAVAQTLFLPPDKDTLYGLYLLVPFWGLTAAGAVSLIWLVLRRNSDNFGRDYYILATRWCAAWGLVGALGLACVAVYSMWLLLLLLRPSRYEAIVLFLGGAIFVPFAIGLLFALIARSPNPMRHKFTMVLALFGLIAFGMYASDLYLALPGALERLQFSAPYL